MINDIDINKIVVFNKLPFGKHDFKYLIGYKDSGKNLYAYSVHKQLYIKEILIKWTCLVKVKVSIKYMEVLEKARNIVKNKFNSKFIYSKKYLKGEKKTKKKQKEALNVYMHR